METTLNEAAMLRKSSTEHRIQYEADEEAMFRKIKQGATFWESLGVMAAVGRPIPIDIINDPIGTRTALPRVVAENSVLWLEATNDVTIGPNHGVSVRSSFDVVDTATRTHMVKIAKAIGREREIAMGIIPDIFMLAALARHYTELPPNTVVSLDPHARPQRAAPYTREENPTRNAQDGVAVLSEDQLVQILCYVVTNHGDFVKAMHNSTVPLETQKSFDEIIRNPAHWGVSPSFAKLAELIPTWEAQDVDDGEALVRTAIAGVVLRCFYGGVSLLPCVILSG
jgi:hypothetical protein